MSKSRYWQLLDKNRWAVVRRAALERDGYRCRKCGKAGRLEVDHVRPLHRGGAAYSLDNTQVLCRACHILKTQRQNRRPKPAWAQSWDALVSDLQDPVSD